MLSLLTGLQPTKLSLLRHLPIMPRRRRLCQPDPIRIASIMAGRVLGKAYVLVPGTEGRQAGADDSDGGLDEGPDGRLCVYPAAICEGDAADGDDADDTDYADAKQVVR